MEKKDIKVTNRSGSFVGYGVDEMNLRRDFAPNETKTITEEELLKLSYQPGGQALIDAYFLIHDKELASEVSPQVSQEPEYNLTEEEVKAMLKKQGNLDEFLDCLDFAPDGVKDLIKSLSVSMPLTDTEKMEAIQKVLGFNVANAIRIRKESEVDKKTPTRERRVKESTESTQNPPKYRRVDTK